MPDKRTHQQPESKAQKRVQRAYDLGLMITAIALPFSNFLMSQGAFLLLFAWALDRWHNGPIFRDRSWAFWRSQPLLWGVFALFSWQLIGQLWTEDLAQGWRALRIQLPLLAFPLILITGRWNRSRGRGLVQHTLAFSVVAACLAALWTGHSAETAVDARAWSPFISHIRFSLMIAFIFSWWLWEAFTIKTIKAWGISLSIGLLGAAFTWKSASITGAVLMPLSAIAAFQMVPSIRSRKGASKKWMTGIAGIVMIGLTWGITSLWPQYPVAETLENRSDKGTAYEHFPDRCMKENGHHVWVNIAWNELSTAWNERSAMAFEGRDGRDQELRMTLLRYMSSLGLKKDGAGLAALSPIDVARIESGIPTILEEEHNGLLRRWDIVKFEVWNALDGGNPSGHSLVQRLLFIQNAFEVFRTEPALGVGTGDVPSAIAQAYQDNNSPLSTSFRLRPHNQYISFLIAGGPMTLILWVAMLIAFVAVRPESYPNYPRQIAVLGCLIIALSCMTEDTLETQAGVTFVGFLLGLIGAREPSVTA